MTRTKIWWRTRRQRSSTSQRSCDNTYTFGLNLSDDVALGVPEDEIFYLLDKHAIVRWFASIGDAKTGADVGPNLSKA